MSTCSLCNKSVSGAFGLTHRVCSHMTHVDCFNEYGLDVNYKKCPQCMGQVDAPIVEEPVPKDGIDYVKNPGVKPTTARNMFSSVKSMMTRKKQESLTPGYDLLVERVPVLDIMSDHGMGLQHLLKEGVDIDDFLVNGYTWDDIKIYKDLNKGTERARQVLLALDVRATHLRDNPEALPPLQIKDDLGLINADFCTILGLYFPENGSLVCDEDKEWTARDCVNFGLNIQDLADFGNGLQYLEQYEDLMMGLTQTQATKAEKELGTTKAFLRTLVDLTAQQQQQQQEEEEEEEERKRLEQQYHEREEKEKDSYYNSPHQSVQGYYQDSRPIQRQAVPSRSRMRNQMTTVDRATWLSERKARARANAHQHRHGYVGGSN